MKSSMKVKKNEAQQAKEGGRAAERTQGGWETGGDSKVCWRIIIIIIIIYNKAMIHRGPLIP